MAGAQSARSGEGATGHLTVFETVLATNVHTRLHFESKVANVRGRLPRLLSALLSPWVALPLATNCLGGSKDQPQILAKRFARRSWFWT